MHYLDLYAFYNRLQLNHMYCDLLLQSCLGSLDYTCRYNSTKQFVKTECQAKGGDSPCFRQGWWASFSWRMACIAVKGWALMSAACISLPFSP